MRPDIMTDQYFQDPNFKVYLENFENTMLHVVPANFRGQEFETGGPRRGHPLVPRRGRVRRRAAHLERGHPAGARPPAGVDRRSAGAAASPGRCPPGAPGAPGAAPPAFAEQGFDGPRACAPGELASAVDLLNHVFRGPPAAIGGPPGGPDLGWAYSFVYHPRNLENLRVVCRRGRVVSLAAIYDTEVRTDAGAVRVGGVSGVGTHPVAAGGPLASGPPDLCARQGRRRRGTPLPRPGPARPGPRTCAGSPPG